MGFHKGFLQSVRRSGPGPRLLGEATTIRAREKVCDARKSAPKDAITGRGEGRSGSSSRTGQDTESFRGLTYQSPSHQANERDNERAPPGRQRSEFGQETR